MIPSTTIDLTTDLIEETTLHDEREVRRHADQVTHEAAADMAYADRERDRFHVNDNTGTLIESCDTLIAAIDAAKLLCFSYGASVPFATVIDTKPELGQTSRWIVTVRCNVEPNHSASLGEEAA